MRNLAAFLFCTTFLYVSAQAATLESAVQKAHELKLGTSNEWYRLLHYSHTILRTFESQADGPSFFVSPKGKHDSEAELDATLEGFFKGTIREWPGTRFPKQSVRCQFPARWRWLSQQLGIQESDIPQTDKCEKALEWKNKIAAKSVTLVFSSYYMNNPSSTFGHSLLRLNKSEHASGLESAQLLDYGINYAASAATVNPLFYAIYGLAGILPGDFVSIPYYYKVREYNDSESRDLWEYDLNLTKSEVDMLVDHLWELGATYFDYYYLSENCSYHMLTALDAAAPRLHLVEHIPFWVIPADTVKALTQEPELIKTIHYRPSIRTQFLARAELMTSDKELKAFDDLTNTREFSDSYAQLDQNEKVRVLDAALDFIDYKYSNQLLLDKEPAYVDWKRKFLLARSTLPATGELKLRGPEDQTPHDSHPSARLGVGGFQDQNEIKTYEFSNRFALHDHADPTKGYLPNAKIEFLHFRFRYKDVEWDRELKLQEAMLFSLDSFSSWNRYEKPTSWRFQLGVERLDDLRCDNCLSTVLKTGGGITWDWFKRPLLTQYAIMGGNVNTSSLFPGDKWSLSVGPITGLRWVLNQNLIFHGEMGWFTVWHSSPQELPFALVKLRWSPIKDWSLNISTEWAKLKTESGLGVFYYW